jgi:hypothetical protein
MTRLASTAVFLLLLAASGLLAPALAAPSRVSSRMRSLANRMETAVRADAESVALDTIAVRALRLGYELVSSDREHMRLRLEKPATLAEVGGLGRSFEGSERKRLDFEVVRGRQPGGRLRVIGALTLVVSPGATGQVELDLGKRQPFRNELKTLIGDIRMALGP